jgi:hypothetical protein
MIKKEIMNMPDDVLARLRAKAHGDEPKPDSDLSAKTNKELREILWKRGYQTSMTLNKAQLIELVQTPDPESVKKLEQIEDNEADSSFSFPAPVQEVIAQ